jgi:hypothetical protein
MVLFSVTVFSTGLIFSFPKTAFAVDISMCQTLDQANTTYTLVSTFGTGGDCLNITANNITINGGGFTVGGNINAKGSQIGSGSNGFSIILQNIVVTGYVDTSGANGTNASSYGDNGGNGVTRAMLL